MQSEISDLKCLQNGMVRMVSAYGVLRRLTPEFIFSFNENNPKINLDYMEFPDQYIDQMVLEEKADIGFAIGQVDDEKFEKTLIHEEDIMLLVPVDHAIAAKESISFNDIENCDFVIESSMFKLHNSFVKKCNQHGFEPNILFNTSGFGLCHKLCAEKKGLSLTLKSNFSDMLSLGLKLIPFDEEFKWQIYMITKKNKNTGDTVEAFKKHTLNWKI